MVVVHFGTLHVVKICPTFTVIHLKVNSYEVKFYIIAFVVFALASGRTVNHALAPYGQKCLTYMMLDKKNFCSLCSKY